MVSKNQIKLISSLHQKKFRKANQLFIAEGKKVIQELIDNSFELVYLYTTDSSLFNAYNPDLISDSELRKISALTNPNDCLAVFKIPIIQPISNQLILALDNIKDPGNFGTIIRVCDWFGISDIICSNETVDLYNPKVVQATMGSLSRVNILYCDLATELIKYNLPIYGTFMDGNSIYNNNKIENGIIVMGNEANGISSEIEKLCSHKISIPRFGSLQATESLNVAMATGILLAEIKRKSII